jgi:hypothetical protein
MRRSMLLIVCLLAGWSVSPASAAQLYGVANDGDIYTIDQTTGTRQLLMASTGVAWCDAADGPDLSSFFGTANGGSLFKVNLVTNTVSAVGAYGAAAICTLAYAEPASPGDSGTLYGSDQQRLYKIDTNSGAATLIAPISRPGDYFIGVGSMDYDPVAQRLYVVNDFGSTSTLYSVNTINGAATLVGALSIPVTDLWFDRDSGKMYGTHRSNTQLYEINTSNAQVTPIGTTPTGAEACEGILGLGGLNVPEPGMVALLGFGAVGFVFRPGRRRNR